MKSYLESQITWNLYQDSKDLESCTPLYFLTDPLVSIIVSEGHISIPYACLVMKLSIKKSLNMYS